MADGIHMYDIIYPNLYIIELKVIICLFIF
jgi:hypothetical protein